jgi:DNA-binding Lrp family transcriptional regulator
MVVIMGTSGRQWETFDEIDSTILHILAENPRKPYSEITEELSEAGFDMSTEGVRYRVENILDTTTVFFLLDPDETEWELVRLAITATDDPGATEQTFEVVRDLPFWHVSSGLGSYDVYAVGSLPNVRAIDETLTKIREYEFVESVEHIVVTERNRDMSSYLNMDYISIDDELED